MSTDARAGGPLSRVDTRIIGATLLVKLALLALGVVAAALLGTDAASLLGPWDRWDAPHYTDLAVFGYRDLDGGGLVGPGGYRSIYPGDLPLYIVFYPLYPWLVAAVTMLLRDPVVAAFLVSGAASLFVGPLLYRLVAIDEGPAVARRSVWFLLLFPTAYFLHIGYTESLFLALVLGSFLAARTDRWWLAGALGAFAALTRVNGLILVPALAAEALVQWWPRGEWRWRWLAIGLVPMGFVAYLGLNLAVYGDLLAFLEIQREHWFKSLSPPWVGIAGVIESGLKEPLEDAVMYGWVELVFIGLGLVGTVVSAFRFRPSWTVWMAGNWLLFVSTSFVLSVPRYSLVLFPLFVWFALLARSWRGTLLVGGLSAAGLVYFAGRFALGQWAF